ncbi:MAG: TerC family protein [Paucibacter sp.]|nr:TerC family protein [Roseateles sp.]
MWRRCYAHHASPPDSAAARQVLDLPSSPALGLTVEFLLDPNTWLAFAVLTALEIVLGIDNIIFLAILVGRLPPEKRDSARRLGLAFAMLTRLGLLLSLSWVMGLTAELFSLVGHGFSGRDLVLLGGGLFLLYKASHEIFMEVEGGEHEDAPKADGSSALWSVIVQIAIIDIVFSLDSVITAVGMVDNVGVMMGAVVAAVAVMMFAAKPIGDFVDLHPSLKVLALAFLVMVGMALTAEAFDQHVPKGYLYAAMCFSLAVEALNIRSRKKRLAARARA